MADGFRLRPPDLIIQDEFHLITGPLGTIAGLYETAVDRLSAWELDGATVHPKVVASTATIRRANDQVRQVFARGTRIFPPQVIDVRDTFFARQVPTDEAPGRLYVGICAQGRRLKEAESRLFRTVMAAAQKQWDDHGPAADPWMTTVGYFSSIRELAGMRRIADDELPVRLNRIERERRDFLATRFLKEDEHGDTTFWNMNLVELTSRVGSADLRDALVELGTPHRPDDNGNPVGTDIVLATNMISVGVDVPRLGLMIVVGQPKTTAEYIQASSRVGRSADGARAGVHAAQLGPASGPVALGDVRALPRDLLPPRRGPVRHAVRRPCPGPGPDRGARVAAARRGRRVDTRPRRQPPRRPRCPRRRGRRRDRRPGPRGRRHPRRGGARQGADPGPVRRPEAPAGQAPRRSRGVPSGEGSQKDNLVALLEVAESGGQWGTWTMPMSMRNTEPGINVLLRRPKVLPPPARPQLKFNTSTTSSAPAGVSTIADVDIDELEEAEA